MAAQARFFRPPCQPQLTAKRRICLGACTARAAIIEVLRRLSMAPMTVSARSVPRSSAADNGQPRHRPPDEAAEEDEAQELPVSPDEGVPLIPDDERVVDMPS
jgi:hypothetical protein